MKYIVVGLGNFGSSLALKLSEAGHEVIGIDSDDAHINMYKDKLTHILKMDSTNEVAVRQLPLSDTDAIIIGIGEAAGAAITAAALFKKYAPKCRIVARYTSDIQKTIFEAMGIDEIVNPEAEFAHIFANRLTIPGNINTYLLDNRYEIIEIKVPKSFVSKTVGELAITENYNVSLITILRHVQKKNLLGKEVPVTEVVGVMTNNTTLEEDDTLLLFGRIKTLETMVNQIS